MKLKGFITKKETRFAYNRFFFMLKEYDRFENLPFVTVGSSI